MCGYTPLGYPRAGCGQFYTKAAGTSREHNNELVAARLDIVGDGR